MRVGGLEGRWLAWEGGGEGGRCQVQPRPTLLLHRGQRHKSESIDFPPCREAENCHAEERRPWHATLRRLPPLAPQRPPAALRPADTAAERGDGEEETEARRERGKR